MSSCSFHWLLGIQDKDINDSDYSILSLLLIYFVDVLLSLLVLYVICTLSLLALYIICTVIIVNLVYYMVSVKQFHDNRDFDICVSCKQCLQTNNLFMSKTNESQSEWLKNQWNICNVTHYYLPEIVNVIKMTPPTWSPLLLCRCLGILWKDHYVSHER